MTILLVNDDGIDSLATKILYDELSKKHKVYMVVPSQNRSGVSHSITVFREFCVRRLDERVYVVDAMPADCVKVALLSLIREKVDITVSGVNIGPNLGLDVYYSGTFSAARESALLGVKSISSSVNLSWGEVNEKLFRQCAIFISKLIDYYPINYIPVDIFPNINIPNVYFEEIKGVSVAKPYERYYFETSYTEVREPEGDEKFRCLLNGGVREHQDYLDSDIYLCKNGYITYTMYSYYPFKDVSKHEIIAYEAFSKSLEVTKLQINL